MNDYREQNTDNHTLHNFPPSFFPQLFEYVAMDVDDNEEKSNMDILWRPLSDEINTL
jgi:hypothetical protein